MVFLLLQVTTFLVMFVSFVWRALSTLKESHYIYLRSRWADGFHIRKNEYVHGFLELYWNFRIPCGGYIICFLKQGQIQEWTRMHAVCQKAIFKSCWDHSFFYFIRLPTLTLTKPLLCIIFLSTFSSLSLSVCPSLSLSTVFQITSII